MSMQEEDQLLEIANDGGLKSMFETTTLPVFWIKVTAEYPEIATTALKTLLPFPTSYLCEAGFSAVTATKTKYRSRLDVSNTLRVSLSPIIPRWGRLVAGKQAQGSQRFSNRPIVSCIFHALYICFCVVSYFEGMFNRYHSDQRLLGAEPQLFTHVMLFARCYEGAANKVA